jgi:DNA-binding LacI/PurR family transcriptional regulator
MTIGEIARLAGVSKTTVSRVLNEKPDVDPATREKILGLIAEYGFQPNAFAKAISQQKSLHVGLLIPHKAEYVFSNPFYTDVMHGVSTQVDRCGYYLLMCYAHESNYLDIYRQKRVDGFVLLSPGYFHQNIIDSLNKENVPFVSTAKISDEENMVFVDVDNFKGGAQVTEHLIGLGHRNIAYIGKPTLTSSLERMQGYRSVLEAHGLQYSDQHILVPETSSIESGHDSTIALLQGPDAPTAIFLANDVMAIGAINAVHELGMRVPDDVSIVGFDDIPLARYVNPPLTTVRQPTYEKGSEAARLLIEMLETNLQPQSKVLDVEMVVRASTGFVSSTITV